MGVGTVLLRGGKATETGGPPMAKRIHGGGRGIHIHMYTYIYAYVSIYTYPGWIRNKSLSFPIQTSRRCLSRSAHRGNPVAQMARRRGDPM